MFLDYDIDMLKYRFQLTYFLGLIFNSRVYTEDINLMIPSISESNYYSLTDLCILLCCLEGPFLGRTIRIHIPQIEEQGEWVFEDKYDFGDEEIDLIDYNPALGGVKYDFGVNYTVDPTKPTNRYDFGEETDNRGLSLSSSDSTPTRKANKSNSDSLTIKESGYIGNIVDTGDWIKNWHYNYFWKNTQYMIYGFNLLVDLDEIEKNISIRHSAFGFEKGYTLSDFGCDKFMTADTITTVDQLNEIYMTNKECFDNLMNFFENECDTRDKAVVGQYIFDNLFLTDFDMEFYRLKTGEIAEYYIDILKERSYSLYRFYIELTKEPDLEVQKDGIRNVMNEIVSTLEYFIGNQTNLQYIFSFVPTSSSEAILQYLTLIINFFKSWKVYFLDPTSTYRIKDKYDEQIKFYESVSELKYEYWKDDQISARDTFYTNIQIYLSDPLYAFNKEILEIYAYFDIDPNFDNVYDGAYPDLDVENIIDANGGIVNDCIPFVMVNGGTPYGIGLFDTITLDGASPIDQHTYADINGFRVDDPAGKLIGNDLQPVGYSIFGGFPGKRWSDSLDTKISDQLVITNDLLISEYTLTNDIIEDPNGGIYLGNTNGITEYPTREDYKSFADLLNNTESIIIPRAENYLYYEKLFSSEPYMYGKVNKEFHSIVYPIFQILDQEAIAELIGIYNTDMGYFEEWFLDTYPFLWELVE